MPTIIDLSMPIEDHFRWPVERRVRGDHAQGDVFEATWIGATVHGFTHIDSPRHCVPGGPTTDDVPLEQTVGDATVFDLAPVEPNEAITPARLAPAAKLLRPDDIVVMRSCWEHQRSPRTEAFWTEAPYLTREAAEWLLARQPKAVAFDFPQDYPIRLLLQGESRPLAENVTHDVLLRNGVILIEYLANTAALTEPRVWFCCLPLKLPGADGAPARAIAIEHETRIPLSARSAATGARDTEQVIRVSRGGAPSPGLGIERLRAVWQGGADHGPPSVACPL